LIALTDAAIAKATEKVSAIPTCRRNIRIGLTGAGCVGYEYTFDYEDEIQKDDWIGDFGKFKILISKIAQPFLEGSTLDWTKDGVNQYFKLNNPKEVSQCGCGVSVQFN